jgi:type III pantothenate kinase
MGIPLLLLSGTQSPGLEVRYDPPESLGPDRIANAYSLLEGPLPAVVVDLGTATKLDVVDAEGRFVGGAILPGVESGAEGLFRRTARLGPVPLEAPAQAIGTTTADCLRSGVILGHAAAIDGLIERFEAEIGPLRVVATGGAAPMIAGVSRRLGRVVPEHTLRGLFVASERSRA